MRTLRFASTVLCALGSAAAMVAQGLVLESETRRGTEVQQGRMYISGERLRFDNLAANGQADASMIFQGDREVLFSVNHRDKSFTRLDRQTMQGLAGQMNSAMAEMQKQLAAMPADQRRMVEEMMKKNMPAAQPAAPAVKREVRSNGGRRTVDRFACEGYDLLENGRKVGEIWATDWSAFGADEQTFAGLKRFGEFMDGLMQAFRNNAGVAIPGGDTNFYAGMEGIRGAPVLMISMEGGAVKSETRLIPKGTSGLTASLFEPPGYKEISLQQRP